VKNWLQTKLAKAVDPLDKTPSDRISRVSYRVTCRVAKRVRCW